MNSSKWLTGLCSLMLSTSAIAAGFDVPVIATSMQGTANANSAETSDPSVIYYNPAGIAHLRGRQMSNSISLLSLTGKVENQGTTGTPPPSNTNNSDDNPGALTQGGGPGTYWPKLIGSAAFFASAQWDDQITLGLGIFPAAGGNINYKADWFGRNFADSTAVEIVNANTVAAIRFDDQHSIGIGTSLFIGHLKQKLHIDVDGIAPYLLQPVIDDIGVGTVGSLLNGILGADLVTPELLNSLNNLGVSAQDIYQLLPTSLKGTIAQLGGQVLLTNDSNGSGTIEMYGYGFGWNMGYMFRPDEKTQIGLAYRSEGRLYMRGEIDWEVSQVRSITDNLPPINGLPAPDGSGNVSAADFLADYYRPDATTKSLIKIPARLSLGYFRTLNDRIDLMFDATFIESSTVRQVKVTILDEPAPNGTDMVVQKPGAIAQNWKDSYKLSIGMNYRLNESWLLRSGYQFDKTPIPSAEFRHPSAPDNNRHMVSVGARYFYSPRINIDMAYSLMHIEDANSRYRDPCRGAFLEEGDSFSTDKAQDCTGNGGTFRGRFSDTFIHILGLQINSRF